MYESVGSLQSVPEGPIRERLVHITGGAMGEVTDTCPFCEIVSGRAPARIIAQGSKTMTIEPLDPVTPGHVLVLPKRHHADAGQCALADPDLFKSVMWSAAFQANSWKAANIITSIGLEATQTVDHLHVHVVPRHEGDGLMLPWTGQRKSKVEVSCPGSGLLWPYSSPWLVPGMPICCPRCGGLITLVQDRPDAGNYAVPMSPEHGWEPR
jgi:histidine triad (HIT) family protein